MRMRKASHTHTGAPPHMLLTKVVRRHDYRGGGGSYFALFTYLKISHMRAEWEIFWQILSSMAQTMHKAVGHKCRHSRNKVK